MLCPAPGIIFEKQKTGTDLKEGSKNEENLETKSSCGCGCQLDGMLW